MDILIYLVSAASCPHKLYERKKKNTNIATFQGIECVQTSWSVWPWDVAGNPKHWRRISQMQRHFRGSLCGFPGGSDGKESTLNAGDPDLIPELGSSPGNWKREWLPTLVFLPGKSHGQKSLAGYSHKVAKSRIGQSTHTHLCLHLSHTGSP